MKCGLSPAVMVVVVAVGASDFIRLERSVFKYFYRGLGQFKLSAK